MATRYRPINLTHLQTVPIRGRECTLTPERMAEIPDPALPLKEFFHSLPRTGCVEDLFKATNGLMQATLAEKDSVWLIDDAVIEAGLSPIIIRLINKGIIRTVAMTGTAAVHDFELAFHGRTGEEIRPALKEGQLGMTRETGEGLNTLINDGVKRGFGLGECLGRGIMERQPRLWGRSILAACAQRPAAATVHVGIGTDGFQANPLADGALLGKGSHKDLVTLASRLEGLNEGGVLVSLLSGAHLEPVLHTALSLARNIGIPCDGFSFIRLGEGGPAFAELTGVRAAYVIPGPIEVMAPLFAGVVFSLFE